ncbi:putative two-component system response regulator, LuxR family protein [Streptomyces longispororuber]|uniref:Two-component system response regulator, LuxR family protein n=1 Tax=Streptomyces longispororuber TaxID=68230 RepID=A0A918ZMJ2_9ACTN|nr:response regulator transcription factor [Streptomyces longispororuber]GHE58829.1 putative two-component system response regulator, LuxR family protein [Streptomyces longispororuber]
MPEPPGTAPLRLVIAEDHYLVREGTRRLLEDTGEVRVLAAVGTATELLDAVGRLLPDVVIADIRMPPGHHTEGITAAHAIRAAHPGIGVVVLSQHANENYAFDLFRCGTNGLAYLLKERIGEVDELLRALHEVTAGRSVVDPRIVEVLIGSHARAADAPLSHLTRRELDVLRQMAEGKTNRAIAACLNLSESTVEKHVNSTFAKLGLAEIPQLHRRVSAVLAYLRHTPAGPV